MTRPDTPKLLDMNQVAEPFDLMTALSYLTKRGEFIRCVRGDLDFYFYEAVEHRPAMIDGNRQLVSVKTIKTATQWQGAVAHMDMTLLTEKCFYVMRFKETGEPDWERPVTSLSEGGMA